MGDSGKLVVKTNFAIKHKWEPFYTGGSIATCEGGRSLLCTCGDSIQVIDVGTGAVKHTLSQEGDDVTCVLSSHDNNFIVSATKSLLLKQWKIEEEKSECVRTWKAIHSGPITCMDFDATSTLLATGSSDSTIKVWDMVRQYCTHNLRGSRGVVSVVAFHPNDLKIFSASDDYVIRMWDLLTSRCISLLKSHVSAVTSLAFTQLDPSKGEVTLISGARDSVLCVWKIGKEEKASIEPKQTIPVYETIESIMALPEEDSTKLLPENETPAPLVVTAGNNGILRTWNINTGKCVYTQKINKECQTESESKEKQEEGIAIVELLALKTSGKYATVTYDHNINIFEIKDGFVLDKHLVGYNDEVLDVKFFGHSDTHIVVATNSPLIKVFDLKSSACQLLHGHKDSVLSLDVFKDCLTFASGSKDNMIRVWRMDPTSAAVSCIAVGRGHTHAVASVACSRVKSDFLVSGSQDQTLKIWKFPEFSENNDEPYSLKAKHTIKAHEKDINSVTISPNDKLVATGSQDKTAKLWNVADGIQLGIFRGHKRGIWCAQFSPTDQVLGSSSADGTIKLWSLTDYACLKTFEGHDCSVLKVVFISKGTQMMSSGSDGLLKMWNIKSSECVNTFDGHDDKVWGLTTNTADNLILSGAADSKIIQWEDVTLKEKEVERKTEEKIVLRQQELNNLIHEKAFAKALGIAITLEQPFTALKVVKEIRWQDDGKSILEETVTKMRPDQKDTLLKFVISWNTNSRNCHEAQSVLNHIIRSVPPEELMSYSNAQTAIEALIPYTERHFNRMSKILQRTTFVNYVWQLMKLKPVNLEKEDSQDTSTQEIFAIDKDPEKMEETEKEEIIPDEEESEDEESEESEDSEPSTVNSLENGHDEKLTKEEIEDEYVTPPKKMRLRSARKKSLERSAIKQAKKTSLAS